MKKRVFSILTLCLLLAGAVATVVTVKCQSSREEADEVFVEQESVVENNVENLDSSFGEENKLIRMRKRAAKDINGNSSVTIEAEVSPVVIDNTLIWTIEWATESSMKVSDYVRMTVSQDTLSATLQYLNGFETQIIVTATSHSTPTVSAQCTVDCYKRTSEVNYFELIFYNGYYEIKANNGVLDCTALTYNDVLDINVEEVNISSVQTGTVNGNYTQKYKYTIDATAELGNILDSMQLTMGPLQPVSVDFNDYVYIHSLFETITGRDGLLENVDFLVELSKINDWFVLTVIVEDYYNNELIGTYEKTYHMKFDISDSMNVEEVTLNNNQIIF